MKLERTAEGLVIHSPLEYDLRAALRARGRDRAFRRSLVELARIRPGDSVLDVGCATGSLALAAKDAAGARGAVYGVDPSPAMIKRARAKARRARLGVRFEVAVAQRLPFDNASFDAITCTLVLHQLPHDELRPALTEMRRVLAPGGRLLLVDIDLDSPDNPRSTPHAEGRRHGLFDLRRIAPLLGLVGLAAVEEGSVPFRLSRFERLRYIVAA